MKFIIPELTAVWFGDPLATILLCGDQGTLPVRLSYNNEQSPTQQNIWTCYGHNHRPCLHYLSWGSSVRHAGSLTSELSWSWTSKTSAFLCNKWHQIRFWAAILFIINTIWALSLKLCGLGSWEPVGLHDRSFFLGEEGGGGGENVTELLGFGGQHCTV